jgi:hypothetical protein
MRIWTKLSLSLVLAVVAALVATASFSGEKGALNRSFYVPVQLSLCEHLEDAVLYRGDTPLARLPGTHVFQFTFYTALERLEPELERVRVEGTRDGDPFRIEIIVTPSSVYVGSKKIDLDIDELMARMRRAVDARHETVTLTLRCSSGCGRKSAMQSDETR